MFAEPEHFIDTHGLDTPPYEERDGCPACGGAYARTYECGCCGRYITGDYVKVDDDERYCEECYRVHELGDED
jgi:hypothetical protein